MKRLLMHLVVVVMAGMPVTPVQAGHNKCKTEEQGAPCKMNTCAHLAKKQQWCSKTCHKDCCFCPKSCNGHNPERQPNPDEEGF